MSRAGAARRLLRVAWSLRVLALFLLGPAVGVFLVAAIFGLPTNLRWMAAIVFCGSAAMLGLLARGEWRRLADPAQR